MNRDDICAQCTNFRVRDYPDLMNEGKGHCVGYDAFPRRPNNLDLPWNTKACIWFAKDWTNREAREKWAEKWRLKEQNNNAVQPETKG